LAEGDAGGALARSPQSGTIYTYDLSSEKAREPGELVEVGEEFERKIRSRQEWVRTSLAVGAFASLVVVLLSLVFAVFPEITVNNLEKLGTVIVTPLTGIVGTIIGFYFAERRSGGG